MPLSKKRQAEWMRNYRKTVIPSVIPKMTRREADKIVREAFGSRPDLPSGKDYVDEVRGHTVQPIPNCPDGRYRDAVN